MALPVYFNCKGGPMEAGDSIPALLEKQVQSSVYWEDTVRAWRPTASTPSGDRPGKTLTSL